MGPAVMLTTMTLSVGIVQALNAAKSGLAIVHCLLNKRSSSVVHREIWILVFTKKLTITFLIFIITVLTITVLTRSTRGR